jgi:hypothetical protein
VNYSLQRWIIWEKGSPLFLSDGKEVQDKHTKWWEEESCLNRENLSFQGTIMLICTSVVFPMQIQKVEREISCLEGYPQRT